MAVDDVATGAVRQAAHILGPRARLDEPVGPLTTYRVGGRAAVLWRAEDTDGLIVARQAVVTSGVPVLVVGKGSNLLVADAGFPGLVIVLGDGFGAIEIRESLVYAGASVSLPVLARRTASAALTGLEWAVGVPGSVGGAIRMNAGGHGSSTAESLVRCGVVDLVGGPDGERLTSDLGFSYRHSSITSSQVVTWAEYQLTPGDRAEAEAAISEIVRWRRENQPGGQNAGSVFTNPADDSAGRLIDVAGLKGKRFGSAEVSMKHANFIQADPGGRADDVRALIALVQAGVEDATGVRLEPELRMVGFDEAGL